MKQRLGWRVLWEACYCIAAQIILLPIICPLLLYMYYLRAIPIPGEWKFKRRMREAGRYRSRCSLTSSSHRSFGTLICDRPSHKWIIARSWWTQDDIHSIAPVVPSDDRYVFKEPAEVDDLASPFEWDEYDRWIYDTYLHPDHGNAMLVSKKFVWTFIKSQRKPAMVTSFSGGRLLEIQSADSTN